MENTSFMRVEEVAQELGITIIRHWTATIG